jgi:hypothetical protein
LGVLEDAAVAMLPYHPGNEQGNRSEAFVHGLGGALSSSAPPIHKGRVGSPSGGLQVRRSQARISCQTCLENGHSRNRW